MKHWNTYKSIKFWYGPESLRKEHQDVNKVKAENLTEMRVATNPALTRGWSNPPL